MVLKTLCPRGGGPCTVSLYVKTIPAPRNKIKQPPAVCWREKAVSQGRDYDIDVFHAAPPLMERLAKYSDAYPLSLLDIQLDGDNGVELVRFLRENKVNAASISRQPEILRRLHGPVCGIPEKRTPLLPNKETAEFLYSSASGSRRAALAEKASSAAFRGAAVCIFQRPDWLFTPPHGLSALNRRQTFFPRYNEVDNRIWGKAVQQKWRKQYQRKTRWKRPAVS